MNKVGIIKFPSPKRDNQRNESHAINEMIEPATPTVPKSLYQSGLYLVKDFDS